jgi:hypothetical protein
LELYLLYFFEKYLKDFQNTFTISFHKTLDAGSNKNIKEIEILLKRNWSFTYHIFIKEIERNI